MGKFLRLLLQLWLLIAFGVLAAGITHYVQAGHVEINEQVKQITLSFPIVNQQITLALWQYSLLMLMIGAALTCVHFGLDAMRKTLVIRRLNKQLQASANQSPFGSGSTQTSGPSPLGEGMIES